MKRSPTDPYACDLTVSDEDLNAIKKTNWNDGFLWGLFIGGMSMLFLSLLVSVVFE